MDASNEGSEDMSPAACVSRGVLLLDRVAPDWLERVNLATLNMADGMRCVAGQVMGTYTAARIVLGSRRYAPATEVDNIGQASQVFMARHGFIALDKWYGYAYPATFALNPVWRETIKGLRVQRGQPVSTTAP